MENQFVFGFIIGAIITGALCFLSSFKGKGLGKTQTTWDETFDDEYHN